GSYVSPEVQFWGVTRPSSKTYIGADLDFTSSDGHLDNQKSGFRFLTANGEFATKLNKQTRLAFNAGINNSFNHLFKLDNDPSALYDITETPRNEYGGFSVGAELNQLKNNVSGWNVQANIRYYQSKLEAGDLSGKSSEGVYEASLKKRWAGAQPYETISLALGGKLGDYNNELANNQWKTGYLGAEYQRLFNYQTHLTANVRLYYGADAFDEQVYFGPTLTIEQPVFEGALLTGEVGAKPYVQTAEELHSANRLLSPQNTFRHSYKKYGKASLKLNYSEVGSIFGGISYEDISDRAIFDRRTSEAPNAEKLFYRTRYADTKNIRLHAGLTHQIIPEKFWINAEAYAQNPELKDGERVPYTEKLGLNSGFGL